MYPALVAHLRVQSFQEVEDNILAFFRAFSLKGAWDVTNAGALQLSPLSPLSPLFSTMINTYQSSMAAPPLPPREGRCQQILIPAPLPPSGNSKQILRFLVGVVLLLLFITVGGFFLLYYEKRLPEEAPSVQARVASPQSEKQEARASALARLFIKNNVAKAHAAGHLQWKKTFSLLKNINTHDDTWVTIFEPGVYHIFSRVTFSKGSLKQQLVSRIKLKKSEKEQEEAVMTAYCHLNSTSTAGPQTCTATIVDLLSLEKGNQLSVWVQDLSLVDYDEGSTTFGMFRL